MTVKVRGTAMLLIKMECYRVKRSIKGHAKEMNKANGNYSLRIVKLHIIYNIKSPNDLILPQHINM